MVAQPKRPFLSSGPYDCGAVVVVDGEGVGPGEGPDPYPATVIPTVGALRCLPPMEPRNGAW
jgi:hypothetical protein